MVRGTSAGLNRRPGKEEETSQHLCWSGNLNELWRLDSRVRSLRKGRKGPLTTPKDHADIIDYEQGSLRLGPLSAGLGQLACKFALKILSHA